MKFSVIITATPESPFLERAVASFARQIEKDAELITFLDPGIGRPASLNAAAKDASGDWLLWLDADDELSSLALLVLNTYIKQNPAAKTIFTGWSMDNIGHSPLMSRDPSRFKAGWITAVRRDRYEELGGFDEQYPYACTMDFRLRAQEAGDCGVISSGLYTVHDHPGRISNAHRAEQLECMERIIAAAKVRRGIEP